MVGLRGFEPPTSTSPSWRATKLRYSPSYEDRSGVGAEVNRVLRNSRIPGRARRGGDPPNRLLIVVLVVLFVVVDPRRVESPGLQRQRGYLLRGEDHPP